MNFLAELLARVLAASPSTAVAAKVRHEARISARVWRMRHERLCRARELDRRCACDPEQGEWQDLGQIASSQGRVSDLLKTLRRGGKVAVRYVYRGREIERADY